MLLLNTRGEPLQVSHLSKIFFGRDGKHKERCLRDGAEVLDCSGECGDFKDSIRHE